MVCMPSVDGLYRLIFPIYYLEPNFNEPDLGMLGIAQVLLIPSALSGQAWFIYTPGANKLHSVSLPQSATWSLLGP